MQEIWCDPLSTLAAAFPHPCRSHITSRLYHPPSFSRFVPPPQSSPAVNQGGKSSGAREAQQVLPGDSLLEIIPGYWFCHYHAAAQERVNHIAARSKGLYHHQYYRRTREQPSRTARRDMLAHYRDAWMVRTRDAVPSVSLSPAADK